MENITLRRSAPQAPLPYLRAEDFIRILHPDTGRGRPVVLVKTHDKVHQRQFDSVELQQLVPALLDDQSYVSMNRFHGQRANTNLACLNAIYADLDYHNYPSWQGKSTRDVEETLVTWLFEKGIPSPSFIIQTGRGLAAIWLCEELPPQALGRWSAAIRALVELLSPFGADKACTDPARVFRIPGTNNPKSGNEVAVSGGTHERHYFDDLADCIYIALQRPTRAELTARKNNRKGSCNRKTATTTMPRGLSPAKRFTQILEDLDTIRLSHGGLLPEGLRNTWLHIYATALTHQKNVDDIEGKIERMARLAVPGLNPGEIKAIARQAAEKAAKPADLPNKPGARYHYRGAEIAQRLCVSSLDAQRLGLKQIMPQEERKRRKAEKERLRRAAKGAVSREEYRRNLQHRKVPDSSAVQEASTASDRNTPRNTQRIEAEPVRARYRGVSTLLHKDRLLRRTLHVSNQHQRTAQSRKRHRTIKAAAETHDERKTECGSGKYKAAEKEKGAPAARLAGGDRAQADAGTH
ncbi:MAG: hypothetical protein R3256_00950 [Thalassovita sp.]|nr:hypothetical protein [Thalassovita sp.]